jgi:glycosyltransferase involved in cell wall biosynthesis
METPKRTAIFLSTLDSSQTFFFNDVKIFRSFLKPFIFILFKNKAKRTLHYNEIRDVLIFNGLTSRTIFKVLRVSLITLFFYPGRYIKLLSQFYKDRNTFKKRYLLYVPFLIYQFDLLKKLKIEQIHAYWAGYAASAARIMAKTLSIPYSIGIHSYDIKYPGNELYFNLKESALIIACNQYIKNKAMLVLGEVEGGKRTQLIHHSIINNDKLDFLYSCPNKNSVVKVVTISRIVQKKGLEYMLYAQKLLIRKGYKIHYTIIGSKTDKAYFKKLKKIIKSSSLQNEVEFTGWVENKDIKQYLKTHHIYVQPSIYDHKGGSDGIPNAILESMQFGIPVVATDQGGIPELINHGENGILIRPKDSENLAEEIIKILNKNYDFDLLIENAKRTVQNDFSFLKNKEKYNIAFNSIT